MSVSFACYFTKFLGLCFSNRANGAGVFGTPLADGLVCIRVHIHARARAGASATLCTMISREFAAESGRYVTSPLVD